MLYYQPTLPPLLRDGKWVHCLLLFALDVGKMELLHTKSVSYSSDKHFLKIIILYVFGKHIQKVHWLKKEDTFALFFDALAHSLLAKVHVFCLPFLLFLTLQKLLIYCRRFFVA